MKIVLALDLATNTGFAVGDASGVTAAGLWDLSRGYPSRWAALWWRLTDALKTHGFSSVVAERPIVYPGRESGARVAFGLAAIAEWWCESKQLPFVVITATEIKKHATGNGGAGKDAVKAAAHARWPHLGIETDDISDALWLLDLALNPSPASFAPAVKARKRPGPCPRVVEDSKTQPRSNMELEF